MTLKALEPLRDPTFRRIWSASLLSNFGQLVLGVGAAWEMTRLAHSPTMVALVQTALMLPLMLVAVPAGAMADMFDRRRIAIVGLSFSSVSAAVLTALAAAGLAGPLVLLAFCFLIGSGVALYSPAWRASISEQVPPEHIPAAVSLGSVSYNIARSFGPALGGIIVLAAGAKARVCAAGWNGLRARWAGRPIRWIRKQTRPPGSMRLGPESGFCRWAAGRKPGAGCFGRRARLMQPHHCQPQHARTFQQRRGQAADLQRLLQR